MTIPPVNRATCADLAALFNTLNNDVILDGAQKFARAIIEAHAQLGMTPAEAGVFAIAAVRAVMEELTELRRSPRRCIKLRSSTVDATMFTPSVTSVYVRLRGRCVANY
jgi:hypothetical protein